MREQTQPLEATQDSRQVAPDTKEPGAGEFMGLGCAGTSCVWREGVGERRTVEPLKDSKQGPGKGQQWGGSRSPTCEAWFYYELWPLSKSTPCLGKINQADQMAVCCAHARTVFPSTLWAAPAFFMHIFENNKKEGKAHFASHLKTSLMTARF